VVLKLLGFLHACGRTVVNSYYTSMELTNSILDHGIHVLAHYTKKEEEEERKLM
jgi:hypothetical protein